MNQDYFTKEHFTSKFYKFFSILFFLLVFFSFLLPPVKVLAAPSYSYGDTTGTWTDNYSDNSGIPTRSKMNVNNGVLQLTNDSGEFTPPYSTSGYAFTSTIIPQYFAKYLSITYTGETPSGTSIKFQIYDEAGYLFPDSDIPNNLF